MSLLAFWFICPWQLWWSAMNNGDGDGTKSPFNALCCLVFVDAKLYTITAADAAAAVAAVAAERSMSICLIESTPSGNYIRNCIYVEVTRRHWRRPVFHRHMISSLRHFMASNQHTFSIFTSTWNDSIANTRHWYVQCWVSLRATTYYMFCWQRLASPPQNMEDIILLFYHKAFAALDCFRELWWRLGRLCSSIFYLQKSIEFSSFENSGN